MQGWVSGMVNPLNVVILEDRPADVELALYELRRAGFDLTARHVDNEADFVASLDPPPDIILADYSLPQWDAPRALRAVQERGLDVPFIMMSGTVGEDIAVECIKLGAVDYLLKDRMARLGSAVKNALEEKRLRLEKQQSETALVASETRYRRLFEAAKDGIMLLDPATGRILDVNPYMCELLGYIPQEFLGKKLWEMGLFQDIAASQSSFLELQEKEYIRYEDLPLVTRDGRSIDVEFVSNVYPVNGANVIQCNIRDITERKRLERREREARALAEALVETAAALTRALDLDTVMNAILKTLDRVVPHDAANIMLIEGDHVRVVHWQGYRPERLEFLHKLRIPVTGTPHIKQMFDSSLPFLASVTDQHPNWVRLPHTEWVKSYVAAPIRSHDNVIGFLNVDSATPGYFTEAHAQRLQAFADQASVAIEHAQLYDEIRRHADELELRVQERTAELNHAKERIEAILNSSSDVMILCQIDGTIEQVNPAFEEVFGHASDEVFSQPLADLVSAENVELLTNTFESVLHNQRPMRVELTVHSSQRASYDADIVLSPVVVPAHKLLGVVCSLRDITERKQMEIRLRQMLAHEMELGEIRSRYVSMAAHDLRNPLAVVKSAVDMIHAYGSRLTQDQLGARFDAIDSNIAVMVEMLDDILTLGRAESGKLTFAPTIVEIPAFCHNLVAELVQATQTAQRIALAIEGNCVDALVDARLLRNILNNLLSNALKYSPADGPVDFSVRCEPEGITFRIQDKGIGIPAGDQDKVFTAFHRASNTGRMPGTGLGLAIVKQSVELHDGTINFESEEGVGTTFTVTIPQTPIGSRHEEDADY